MEILKEQIAALPQPSYVQVCQSKRFMFPRVEPSEFGRIHHCCCTYVLTAAVPERSRASIQLQYSIALVGSSVRPGGYGGTLLLHLLRLCLVLWFVVRRVWVYNSSSQRTSAGTRGLLLVSGSVCVSLRTRGWLLAQQKQGWFTGC